MAINCQKMVKGRIRKTRVPMSGSPSRSLGGGDEQPTTSFARPFVCFTYLLFFTLITGFLVNFKDPAALLFKVQLGMNLSLLHPRPHLLKTNQISHRFPVVEFETLPARPRVESRFERITPAGQSSPAARVSEAAPSNIRTKLELGIPLRHR